MVPAVETHKLPQKVQSSWWKSPPLLIWSHSSQRTPDSIWNIFSFHNWLPWLGTSSTGLHEAWISIKCSNRFVSQNQTFLAFVSGKLRHTVAATAGVRFYHYTALKQSCKTQSCWVLKCWRLPCRWPEENFNLWGPKLDLFSTQSTSSRPTGVKTWSTNTNSLWARSNKGVVLHQLFSALHIPIAEE